MFVLQLWSKEIGRKYQNSTKPFKEQARRQARKHSAWRDDASTDQLFSTKNPQTGTDHVVLTLQKSTIYSLCLQIEKAELKRALVEWVVSSDQPFLETDNDAFRRFVGVLNPNAELPSRNTLKAWIFDAYTEKKERVIKLLHVSAHPLNLKA